MDQNVGQPIWKGVRMFHSVSKNFVSQDGDGFCHNETMLFCRNKTILGKCPIETGIVDYSGTAYHIPHTKLQEKSLIINGSQYTYLPHHMLIDFAFCDFPGLSKASLLDHA